MPTNRSRETAAAPQAASPAAPDSYALIATQGDNDESALESALRSPAKAVLVIASKRKADRLRSVMTPRGIPDSRLACWQPGRKKSSS
jgi:xanthine dehydrogenase accessory factor